MTSGKTRDALAPDFRSGRFRLGLLHQPLHRDRIKRHLPVAIALKNHALAVGRKECCHLPGIAGPMLAQRELALYRPDQQQYVRRSLAAASAHKDAGVGIAIEGGELAGGRNKLVLICIGRELANIVELFSIRREYSDSLRFYRRPTKAASQGPRREMQLSILRAIVVHHPKDRSPSDRTTRRASDAAADQKSDRSLPPTSHAAPVRMVTSRSGSSRLFLHQRRHQAVFGKAEPGPEIESFFQRDKLRARGRRWFAPCRTTGRPRYANSRSSGASVREAVTRSEPPRARAIVRSSNPADRPAPRPRDRSNKSGNRPSSKSPVR